ncbi:acyl-CoA/acyl-ACP dehydrogenase [Streptomyces sp. WI03-4A]|uniref:acyl-CoA dehydrogenase family protein n=1 Tax=Streptomyces TaxID=1883 RepID=UPI0029A0C5F3|nr:acyl-CoA dehydrogenase family protein [Streptomyces sp. WI03-4A]MDX2591360.1 acyl-CoA/acyl-ACP dehydrogenase [Streptomyces sp. WI03-4A]
MRSLDTARSVCERIHPWLLKELEQSPYLERERPGSPAVDLFRMHGGVGLLIPGRYGGHEADPLDALRVQLALGSVSPSLIAAVSMHHFAVAMLSSLAAKGGRLTDEQSALLHRIVPEQLVLASGWAEGRSAQDIGEPAVVARPVEGGFLLSGATKPCSLSRSMNLLVTSVDIRGGKGSGPEPALALVAADAPGLSVHPFWVNALLGGAESDEVRLAEVFVPSGLMVRAGADGSTLLDGLRSTGFVWFQMLISAGYAGGAMWLVEQVLDHQRGTAAERATLTVDMEAAVALLESVARATDPAPGDEDAMARVLVARYTVQNALPDIASRALELLGGMPFICGSEQAQVAAAMRALAFHPPSRSASAESLLRYFDCGSLGPV